MQNNDQNSKNTQRNEKRGPESPELPENQRKIAKIDMSSDQFQQLLNGQKTILEELTSIKNSVIDITIRVNNLEDELNEIKQQQMLKSIRVTGFPPATENVSASIILLRFFKSFGVTLKENDFKNIFVLNNRQKTMSSIMATFYEERKRDEAFAKYRKARREKNPVLVETVIPSLIKDDSPFKGKELRMFTKLTERTQLMLTTARSMLAAKYEFIYEHDGQVLIKQGNGTKTTKIKTMAMLKEIAAKQHLLPNIQSTTA
jgi:ASC-1-like (ASCH) protein